VPLLVTGVLLATHWTAMFAGYERAPDDVVAFIVFLAPVGIALLAPRTLGERLGPRTVAALAVAVAGLVFVAGPSRTTDGAAGLAAAGFAAVTFVALVLVAKPLAEELGGLRLTFLQMVIAGTVLLPLAVVTDWSGDGAAGWLWLVVLGLVHTGIGTALYLTALSRVPATHVGILGYLEPVGVVLFGWLLADASPKLTTLVGGGLIIAAGALVMTEQEEAVRVPG
jgi:drug/metabolite transporter (DMT)-like permease